MKMVAYIRPHRIDDVRDGLVESGCRGVVSQIGDSAVRGQD
jgi:hypothetical protein